MSVQGDADGIAISASLIKCADFISIPNHKIHSLIAISNVRNFGLIGINRVLTIPAE
jgi:hypothetical protein